MNARTTRDPVRAEARPSRRDHDFGAPHADGRTLRT